MVATFLTPRSKRGWKEVVASVPLDDLDTDGSGDVIILVSSLRYVVLESVKSNFTGGKGCLIQPNSASGNILTCRVHLTGTFNAVFDPYTSQTGVGAVGITADGY